MKPGSNQTIETNQSDQSHQRNENCVDEFGNFNGLIEAVNAGNDQAKQQLVESCRDYLLLIANQEFDRDLHAKIGPSDVVQDTLMAVHQHVGDFKGSKKEQFLAWVRQILLRDLNRARREFKGTAKRDARRERPIGGDSCVGRLPIEIGDQNPTPQTNAVRKEENELLDIAMQRLAEEYRNVILFRNSQQLSFQEIGKRMNRSDDAAQKLWKRAIEKLKQELKDLNAL